MTMPKVKVSPEFLKGKLKTVKTDSGDKELEHIWNTLESTGQVPEDLNKVNTQDLGNKVLGFDLGIPSPTSTRGIRTTATPIESTPTTGTMTPPIGNVTVTGNQNPPINIPSLPFTVPQNLPPEGIQNWINTHQNEIYGEMMSKVPPTKPEPKPATEPTLQGYEEQVVAHPSTMPTVEPELPEPTQEQIMKAMEAFNNGNYQTILHLYYNNSQIFNMNLYDYLTNQINEGMDEEQAANLQEGLETIIGNYYAYKTIHPDRSFEEWLNGFQGQYTEFLKEHPISEVVNLFNAVNSQSGGQGGQTAKKAAQGAAYSHPEYETVGLTPFVVNPPQETTTLPDESTATARMKLYDKIINNLGQPLQNYFRNQYSFMYQEYQKELLDNPELSFYNFLSNYDWNKLYMKNPFETSYGLNPRAREYL